MDIQKFMLLLARRATRDLYVIESTCLKKCEDTEIFMNTNRIRGWQLTLSEIVHRI